MAFMKLWFVYFVSRKGKALAGTPPPGTIAKSLALPGTLCTRRCVITARVKKSKKCYYDEFSTEFRYTLNQRLVIENQNQKESYLGFDVFNGLAVWLGKYFRVQPTMALA